MSGCFLLVNYYHAEKKKYLVLLIIKDIMSYPQGYT